MRLVKSDKASIRNRILELAEAGSMTIASTIAAENEITRQAAHAHLAALVKAGQLVAEGATRSRVYRLAVTAHETKCFPRLGLSEDVAWRDIGAPLVKDLPQNVRDIWGYGMTEMINNAIDHSAAENIEIGISRNALNTTGWVIDDGEGIFLKIQNALGLFYPRESILELAKGKLTTDPANHTGEGIFFSSKMFDQYEIRSGNLHFTHGLDRPDFLLERDQSAHGTTVLMKLANTSERDTGVIFREFAAPEEYTFDKTIVPVRLAQYEGEKLVSRSQAKRLTMRFERFRTVILDFEGIESIGQAFADEIFRVFQKAHPELTMMVVHMTADVDYMVKRAQAASQNRA